MAHAFLCQSREAPIGPRVTTSQKLDSRSSVSTCRDRQRMGCTGRVIQGLAPLSDELRLEVCSAREETAE